MHAGKRCGATSTRSGEPCRRPKGWGTDHPGSGRCKWHTGATRNGRKAAAKERALEFARGELGAEVDGSPIDAMEEANRLIRGIVAFYRHKLAEDPDAADLLRREFMDAVKLEHEIGKGGTLAGVAERRQRLAERQAEMFASAIADGLAEVFGELATVERRTAFAAVVRARLLVLEAAADDAEVLDGHAVPA